MSNWSNELSPRAMNSSGHREYVELVELLAPVSRSGDRTPVGTLRRLIENQKPPRCTGVWLLEDRITNRWCQNEARYHRVHDAEKRPVFCGLCDLEFNGGQGVRL